MKALSEKFLVRTFRFSSSTARVSAPSDLTFGGTQTRLANAIESARQELAGLPVSGLVLVTDGADTTDATVADALLASKADALPVFTVGVGQETLAHDIQIGRVSTPRTALKGTSLLVDAVITQTGYAGQTVTLDVEDGGRIVGSQPVRLPADGDPVSVRVKFTATEAGPRVFRLKVAPQPGEVVTAEQPARRADRRPRSQGAHPLLRRGAALRDEVLAAGDQGRQEPRAGHAPAHRREQVPAARRRRGGRRARRGISEDPRGAVRVPRPRARQRRGERVQRAISSA